MNVSTRIPTLLFIAIAFMLGIASQATIVSYYLPLALGAIAIMSVLYSLPTTSTVIIFLCLILSYTAGYLRMTLEERHFQHISQLLPTKLCDIQAQVIDTSYNPEKMFPFQTTLAISHSRKHAKYKNTHAWEELPCTAQLFAKKEMNLRPGMIIQLDAVQLQRITKHDRKLYAMKEGIHCSIFSSSACYKVLEDNSKTSWYTKYALRQDIQNKLSPSCFWLFSAIFLGRKAYEQDAEHTKILFNQWGIAHHLARSGLHLVIIILIWQSIACLIPLHTLIKQLFFILLSLIYLLVSWPSITFYRALWSFILHRACLLLHIRPHMIHIIAIVCVACLMKNPVQLFFLDFQLSFALTFGLIALGQLEAARKYKSASLAH